MTAIASTRGGAAPQTLWHLRSLPAFQRLGEPLLRSVAKEAHTHTLRRKHFMVIDGSRDGSIFFVRKGIVKILRMLPSGEEAVVDLLGPGEFYGCLSGSSCFEVEGGEVVEAIDDAQVISIPCAIVAKCFMASPDFHLEILRRIDSNTERIRARAVDLAFLTAPQRLASFIRSFVTSYGHPSDAGWTISSRLAQQDIGHLTGMSRQSVTTLMTSWREAGYIHFERSTLTLLRLAALEHIASGEAS